ncbi:uncharacterized protein BJ212DRAFT_1485473 [Suillus subaureus]|uniref:Uncharacterized protein n=1 Tax=Suillus subaureus TaxID=48587 RepID=A0A9P7E0L4_9AGAM|nr:uncharacterized protein BJ212DRAFT_1485473 [Suillus subaureus]KAG1807621.1 hypothetical protein BJ212DRAFT_1485473 [Suillus subaureus]
MAIISGTWQIAPGPSHFALTLQAGSCSQGVWGWTPAWHCAFVLQGANACPEHDSPGLAQLAQHLEVLGDHTFDLPVTAPPSTGLIPVDLPSPPVLTSNVTGPSTNTTTEYQDKGKGEAIIADLEPKAEGSRKRKSSMILALSSQLLKPVMKTCKHVKLSCIVKSKPIMESEDEENMIIQPFLDGVPEVIASSHPAVIEPSQPTPKTLVQAPPVIDAGDILIPRLVKQPMLGLQEARLALHNLVGQEDQESVYVMHLLHDKEDQKIKSRIPSKAPSKAPPASQSKAQTCSQSDCLSGTLGVTAVTTPKTQMCGHSKTITAVKAPAPAPASLLSLSSAVPAAALDMPMLDLHAMAIAIRDGAPQITILKAHVAEQDSKINTLQCLNEGLRHEIINWHPSFPIPDPPANATSLCLISLSPLAGMAPTPLKFKDASAIEGLLFEYNQVVHPEDPDMSSEIVDLGDLSNLVPEYNSSNDMDVEVDVEVKVEASSEEVDMAT